MKLKLVLGMTVLALVAAPALAQKVYIEYDPEYDEDPETFAWNDTPETSLEDYNPLMHSRIKNGIEHYISRSGVREVKENPDVWVTYHASGEEEVSFDTTNWNYGYPGGWGGYGYGGGYYGGGYYGGTSIGSSSTTVRTYTRGTLVVDIWDAQTNKLIWRGTASGIVKESPKGQSKQIDTSLAKMVSRWDKMKAKSDKAKAKAAK